MHSIVAVLCGNLRFQVSIWDEPHAFNFRNEILPQVRSLRLDGVPHMESGDDHHCMHSNTNAEGKF